MGWVDRRLWRESLGYSVEGELAETQPVDGSLWRDNGEFSGQIELSRGCTAMPGWLMTRLGPGKKKKRKTRMSV